MNRLAPLSRASASRAAVQLRPQPQRHAVPAIARHQGSRPVERQIELIGQVLQTAGPVRKLARNRALRIALVAENLVLPQRVVGILHRQRRQIRRSAPAARRVEARKIARQWRQRPAVARDVMQQHQQHVLALTKRKQMRPQRRLAGEIEALPRRRRKSFGKSLLAHRRDRKPRPGSGCFKDQLPRNPQRVGEDRAQALVALHHVAERSLESFAVEPTLEPHRHRDRVGRAPPFQAAEEPQPALRKRQRDLGRTRNSTQRRTCRLRLRPDA